MLSNKKHLKDGAPYLHWPNKIISKYGENPKMTDIGLLYFERPLPFEQGTRGVTPGEDQIGYME